jgi:hypothetical protein
VSAFVPGLADGSASGAEHPRLQPRPLPEAERRAHLEVWAAVWRARELAHSVFGSVGKSALLGARPSGPLRGLLCLAVPFRALDDHQEREARFRAAVATDPVLSRVCLVYVLGFEGD